MPEFAYKAADATGSITKGTRFANTEDEFLITIRTAGLHLLEYKETKSRNILRALQEIQVGRVSRRDLIDFSNSMGVMFRAGVPLISALEELASDMDSKAFRKIIGELIEDIKAGDPLNEAMAKRPKAFPLLYTNVVQIGENTGALDAVFFDLAKHYKRIDDLVKNVRKALMYPAFVLAALILAGVVFLTLVFPPLFTLLVDFEVPLPLITKIVMGVSDALRFHWIPIVIVLVVLIIAYFVARRKPASKYYLDIIEINFPVIKGLFIQLRLAFFMRYLSMVLSAGMDILRGLQLATESVPNLVLQRFLTISREQVIEGEFLSSALRKVRYIPNMVTRMIAIGEESGTLPEQMEYVADYYNEELERKITMILALMEPLLLFVLAGLAMALVMGVLLPLYNLVSTLSTGVGTGGG